jgi:PDZ domain-containing secreted protein
MNNSASSVDVLTACDSLTWIDGITYTSSNNTATYVFQTITGCDSIVSLDLTINNSASYSDVLTSCDSLTWIDGINYTSSNSSATYTFQTIAGCDSVVSLDLTINNSASSTDFINACDSLTWIDGTTYTSSNNTAIYTLQTIAGCDSLVSLDLNVNNSSSVTDIQTSCDSFTWIDGVTYTSSNNTATFTLVNAAGCDSLVSLDLTVNQFNLGFTESSTLFTAPPFSVQFNNNTPNLSNYNLTWDFGDSTIVQNNGSSIFHEYIYNGLYSVTLIAEDLVNGCGLDTLTKEDLIYCSGGPNVSIEENNSIIDIYPNPTKENITININNFSGKIRTEVYDIIGNRLQITNETTISLREYSRGIYLLKVAYGDRVEEVKVIKQ